MARNKKSNKPETELRWVKRVREEELFYLVEVRKGASDYDILEAFEASEIVHDDPDDSQTGQDDFSVTETLPTPKDKSMYKSGDIGHRLVEETTFK